MANTYLQRTLGTPTSAYKGTLSWWQKGASTNTTYYVLACESGSERFLWYVSSGAFGGGLRGTSSPPDIDFSLSGTPKFRDVSGWYNFVLAWDSTQSTASDRIKFYVNNVQYAVSSSGTSGVNDIPLNHVMPMNKSGLPFRLGSNITGGNYFTGLMSHIHLIDGIAYDATAFGETDANGVWKIKTSPSVTYGNNGAFILKDGNSVTDQSGNSNNFTVGGGTLTKTEDSPSNVFATWNPLYKSSGTVTFSNGNTKIVGVDYSNQRTGGTLAAKSGKFYFEIKTQGSVSFGGSAIGIADYDSINISGSTSFVGNDSNFIGYYGSGTLRVSNGSSYNDYATLSVGDIIGFAFDIDNGFAYFSVNGVWQNSGDPTSGATGTGNVNRSGNLNYNFAGKLMGLAGGFQSTDSPIANFGNGYFGTTAVSSAGTNASGIGIFEYDVPTGYTALSTKGLNL